MEGVISISNELYFDVFIIRKNISVLVGTKIRPAKKD